MAESLVDVPPALDMANNGVALSAPWSTPWLNGLTAAGRAPGAGGLAQGIGGAANAAGGLLGGVGGILGGISIANGVNNFIEGDHSQGVWDVTSGALGVAAGAGGVASALGSTGALASLACPPVAVAAGVAGLGAFGNKFAEEHGWYGSETDAGGNEVNSTFLGSVGNRYEQVRDAVDIPVLGQVAGGLAGAGQTVWNTGAAITGGIGRAGSAVLDFLSDERLKDDVVMIEDPFEILDSL